MQAKIDRCPLVGVSWLDGSHVPNDQDPVSVWLALATWPRPRKALLCQLISTSGEYEYFIQFVFRKRRNKLKEVDREYEGAQLSTTHPQQPRAAEKQEPKEINCVFENEESLLSAIHEHERRGKRRLPRKEYRLRSLSLTESPAVKRERAVAALKMGNGSMILLDENTQFLHTDDMIKLGSLVPGCEPVIECPKSVVYKGKPIKTTICPY